MGPRVALSLSLLFAALGISYGANAADGASPEAMYRANCAACHDTAAGGAPTRAALALKTPDAIATALRSGVMAAQGAALTDAERHSLATYLGTPAAVVAGKDKRCPGKLQLASAPQWNRWGNGTANQRFQPSAVSGITSVNVSRLKLKWAFGFPASARARSQPAVTPDAIFLGSQDGTVYALDTDSGCVWWQFAAKAEVRSAPTIGVDSNGRPTTLYFGDFEANVYALDAATGALLWQVSVRDHPAGTITGSPTLHAGRLYVPMSSTEIVNAFDPAYPCCNFRGGITALDARDGQKLWRSHTVPTAVPTTINAAGTQNQGPSGAPVWSSPTVDSRRGLLYFGTGENYSSPATAMSDAIVAIDLERGETVWVRQMTTDDAWNGACGRNRGANCPAENGPDFDFGAPPILVNVGGHDRLLAGQKSGMIYALDPADKGRIIWSVRSGMGGFNGGVHWGMATDQTTLFAGIADTPGHDRPTGPPQPGMHAIDIASGKVLWRHIEPARCPGRDHRCQTGMSAAVTLTPGVIFAGALNGVLRAYASDDGRILWTDETNHAFDTINGVAAKGGSIDSAGPVVAGGKLFVNSGYDKFGQIAGNVLLVYEISTGKADR